MKSQLEVLEFLIAMNGNLLDAAMFSPLFFIQKRSWYEPAVGRTAHFCYNKYQIL
jgi:hypothetical protein